MVTKRTMRLPVAAAVVVLVGSGAAACSSSKSSPKPAPTTTSSPAAPSSPSSPSTPSTPTSPSAPAAPSAPSTAPSASGAALKVGLPKFATALTDSTGRALYLFEPDKQGASTCTGACAAAWPPLTTTGTPTITGADAGKLGVVTRADGTKQVTFNHWPLYYFVGDKAPGDTNGQGSKAFGGGWYVVATDGNKIDTD